MGHRFFSLIDERPLTQLVSLLLTSAGTQIEQLILYNPMLKLLVVGSFCCSRNYMTPNMFHLYKSWIKPKKNISGIFELELSSSHFPALSKSFSPSCVRGAGDIFQFVASFSQTHDSRHFLLFLWQMRERDAFVSSPSSYIYGSDSTCCFHRIEPPSVCKEDVSLTQFIDLYSVNISKKY